MQAREWRWPAAIGGGTVMATIVPLLVAVMRTPPGTVFTGYVVIARDAFVYQALWRAGFNGAWLFHPAYTTEPAPGVLLYPSYLWSGHVVGGLPGPWTYHAARLLSAAALLAAVYFLAAELYRPRLVRRLAFLLAALGGGIGVLLPATQIGPLALRPTETASPGTSVADLISMAPHLPWAAALLCWVFITALRARRGAGPARIAVGLAAWLGLDLIYPQLALLGLLVVIAWALLRRSRAGLLYGLAGAAVVAPYLAYLAIIARTAPESLRVIRSSLDVGDPFGFLVLSHLVATVLIAAAVARRRIHGDLWLPALWIAVMTAFMFVPGVRDVVGRSFMASSVPFGLLAAAGLVTVLRAIRVPAWRRRALALSLAASSLYGLFSLAQPGWIAAGRLDSRAEYEPAGEQVLLEWLARKTTPRDVVLTTYLDGLFVPAQTGARAFVGHPDQTIDVRVKADDAVAFFTRWPAAQRDAFMAANGIDYVLSADATASTRLADDQHLRAVQAAGGETLFEVVP